MRYLVTGGTGLVGSHLLEQLAARGGTVRALVRQAETAEKLRQRGIEAHRGDLTSARDVAAAVDGMDVVIHTAGLVQIVGEPDELWRVNVEGTGRLLAASAAARVSRFVYLSSVAVYGHATPPITEATPKQPIGAYGESKWAAEQEVWRYHAEQHLPAVVIRPCAIYGGQDRHTWPMLWRLSHLKVLPLPRGGRRLLDLVHVSDVVEAVIAAAAVPAGVGQAYNITDGQAHTLRDILDTYRQLTGRGATILPVPSWVVGLAAQMGSWLERVPGARERGRRLARLRGLNFDIHYAIDAARRDLSYEPRVGLAEGFRRTLLASSDAAALHG